MEYTFHTYNAHADSGVTTSLHQLLLRKTAGAGTDSRNNLPVIVCVGSDLVIGDSLSSDIQGANNAGLDSCWYNLQGEARPAAPHADYEIRDLRELYDIV